MKKRTVILICIGVIVVVSGVFFFLNSSKKEIRFNTTKIQEETIETSVTATGYLQPVDKVDVGTQVSGVIEKIYVDFNTQVKKGQLLAELDKSTLTEKLSQANASLSSTESDLKYAQQNYDRIKQLYDAKAATEASYEEATNKLTQAKTSRTNAKANLHQAQVNLSYAEIYSPIDGVVLNRAVDQGQTVAASFNTPTLFTIANDLTKMQVEADVDEADIGQVRVGQKVSFTVDAYTDDIFEGTVHQIRLQPTVTSNVVTYTVIIEAPNPEEKLFPGMTASVTIITRSEKGLAVPAEALNFVPTEEMMKQMKKQLTSPVQDEVRQASGNLPAEGGNAPNGKKPNGHSSAKGVWLQTPEGILHKDLKTGLSDGINTIVESGLNEGDIVILSALVEKKAKKEAATSNPLMPRPPGRR